MFTLTVNLPNEVLNIPLDKAGLLSAILEEHGVFVPHPCGGKGNCQKCKVKAEGLLSPGCEGGYVMACRTCVCGDAQIWIEEGVSGLSGSGEMLPKNPMIKTGAAAAIDIGTTTVACNIYDFPGGELLKSACIPNSQAAFGADVLTRMDFAILGGGSKLKDAIAGDLKRLADGFDIKKSVIVGNTAMLHMLAGLDLSSMAVYPFTPQSKFGQHIDDCYIPGCVSAFVGADALAAVMYSDITKHRSALLLDVGTNSEIVLWNGNELLCCSASAGPAFEGGGISQGMYASGGAINKVWQENGEIKYNTVGDEGARGICGSGLIDALALMKRLYAMDKSGFMENDFEIGDSGVFVTPQDIRLLQTAKSAIRSGVEILLSASGISVDAIERIYISGSFGSYISAENAMEIGLLPVVPVDKITILGNGALKGAEMMLKNMDYMKKYDELYKLCKTVSLTDSPEFADLYMKNMNF